MPRQTFRERMKAGSGCGCGTSAETPSTSPSCRRGGGGLAHFADDPYRSLLYFGRDIGYTRGTIPFQEFCWDAWARDARRAGLNAWNREDLAGYLGAVEKPTRARTALPAGTVLDDHRTASELGKRAEWNEGKTADEGEFGELSKPFTDAQPDKLAHALAYEARMRE
nr:MULTISPECIES: ParB-like protein [unclassified Streptomyces]